MKRTILYIEDDPSSRRLVERTLTFAGYDVLVAENGLQGIDLARSNRPDLILTDINLPDMMGYEIAATLRHDERFAAVPIVALTAQGQGGKEWEMAFAAGVNGYITKPINIETLPGQVEDYLGGAHDPFEQERMPGAQQQYTREVMSRLERQIRELEVANRELRELDRIKDTFIELTAHEMRTPLTLVYGYSRLLEEHPSFRALMRDDPDLQVLLQGMSDAIERMQGTVEEIVTISRLMTDQVELSIGPVNLGQLFARAAQAFADAIQGRALRVRYDPAEWPTIRGDSELLYLAVYNLLSNAIKFTPDGGEIAVSARREGERLRFSVRDSGIGIDKAEQKRIFDRFHTTNDVRLHSTSKTAFNGGGLGLGLPICKGIFEAHGGQIWVESAGRDAQRLSGSEFIVSLPLRSPQVS
jgi:signal transduction histidine kinase